MFLNLKHANRIFEWKLLLETNCADKKENNKNEIIKKYLGHKHDS